MEDIAKGQNSAPLAARIIYPSAEFQWLPNASVPPLVGCGKFPVILFVHGFCKELPGGQGQGYPYSGANYKTWTDTLAALARAGYVVLLVDRNDPSPGFGNADVYDLVTALYWLYASSSFRDILALVVGIIGNSYGATAGLRLAVQLWSATGRHPAAYVSLSGAFHEVQGENPDYSDNLYFVPCPSLFMFGSGNDLIFHSELAKGGGLQAWGWNRVPPPTHSVEVVKAGHYDYVAGYKCGYPVGQASGEGFTSYCPATWQLTGDLLVTFFSKYMPPTPLITDFSLSQDSLVPPTELIVELILNNGWYGNPNLDPAQEKFVQGYMTGRSSFMKKGCHARFRWRTKTSGVVDL